MANVWIREFSGGLDVRKLRETSPGGTLIRAIDCHINRGGEIEQRADFVPVYTVPTNSRGLAANANGLVVFTGTGGPITAPPAGITVQSLDHPGRTLSRVLHTTLYNGQIAAIGQFNNNDVRAFLNGVQITDVNAPPFKAGSVNPAVLLTATEKLHIGAGPDLFFSAVAAGTDFGAGSGAGEGFISVATHAQGMERLTGLAIYGEYIVAFSRRTAVIFYVDPDPALNRRAQVLNNTGAFGPRCITEFGDADLFYLDPSGIRSLRARDSSNSAATTDIGSPIDPIILERISTLSAFDIERAVGVIEPRDGRFWLAIGDRIYVFSFFTSSKISAWSEYRPGFVVEDMVEFDGRVYLRSGNTIYVYGGMGVQPQYSAAVQAEAWLPYIDAEQPAREKELLGIDMAVRGTWEVRIGLDVRNIDASDKIGVVSRTTFGEGMIPAQGMSTHMSLRFKCLAPESATGPGIVSSALIHFVRDAEEDA